MPDSKKFLFAPNPFQMCHLEPFPIVSMGYHSYPLFSMTYRDFRRLITQRSQVQILPPQPIRAHKPRKTPPLAWGFFVSTALSRVARASYLETHSRASDSEKVSPTVTCPYPGRSLPMHGRPSSPQARRNSCLLYTSGGAQSRRGTPSAPSRIGKQRRHPGGDQRSSAPVRYLLRRACSELGLPRGGRDLPRSSLRYKLSG